METPLIKILFAIAGAGVGLIIGSFIEPPAAQPGPRLDVSGPMPVRQRRGAGHNVVTFPVHRRR